MLTFLLAFSVASATPPMFRVVYSESISDGSDHKLTTVECPRDYYAIGGDALVLEDAYQGQITWSGPTPGRAPGAAWSVGADESWEPGPGTAWSVLASARCVHRSVWSHVTPVQATGFASDAVAEVSVSCPVGTKVVNGGVALADPTVGFHRMLASTPDGVTGWRATFVTAEPTDYVLTAFCLPEVFWDAHFSQTVFQTGGNSDYQFVGEDCPTGHAVASGVEITGSEATEAVFYGFGVAHDGYFVSEASMAPFGGTDWQLTLTGTCYTP